MPCKILCLLSILLAQALVDDAFEAHFPSVDALMTRPKLKANVDYMPLKWKEEILDQPLLPISYNQYWKTWCDTIQAAGVREKVRPYATRVGAGGRLDGNHSPFRDRGRLTVIPGLTKSTIYSGSQPGSPGLHHVQHAKDL